MSASFTIKQTYGDLLAANWLVLRRRWLWRGAVRGILKAGATVFSFNLLIAVFERSVSWPALLANAGYSLALGIYFFALRWVWWLRSIPKNSKSAFRRKHAKGDLEWAYNFDAIALYAKNKSAQSTFKWRDLYGFRENPKLLVLMHTEMTYTALPKAQISAELLAALKANLIAAHVASS